MQNQPESGPGPSHVLTFKLKPSVVEGPALRLPMTKTWLLGEFTQEHLEKAEQSADLRADYELWIPFPYFSKMCGSVQLIGPIFYSLPEFPPLSITPHCFSQIHSRFQQGSVSAISNLENSVDCYLYRSQLLLWLLKEDYTILCVCVQQEAIAESQECCV